MRQIKFQDWPSVEALARHHLGEIFFDLGEFPSAIEETERAQELDFQNKEMDLAAAASAMLSHSFYRLGQFDVAREQAIHALQIGHEQDSTWVRAEALLAAANCELDLGYYDLALESYQAAIDLARMIGKINNELIPMMNIGLCLTFQGRPDEAVLHLQDTLKRVEMKLANTYLQGPPLFYLGIAYEALGQREDALEAYERSVEVRETDPPMPTQLDSLSGVLRIAIANDDRLTVERLLNRIEMRILEVTWQSMEYPLLALITLADAHRLLGNTAAYAERVREAYDELMRRAALISDPEAVESYLTRVEMNVDVQRRFAELRTR